MNPSILDRINPHKVSEALGISSHHEIIKDQCFEKLELITLKNTYLFDLSVNDTLTVRLSIISDLANEVQVVLNHKDISRIIRFQNISRVLYNPKLKLIIFESKDTNSYSQLRVEHDGKFDLSISNPISNYKNSWITIMGENLGLIKD